jgi:hypothetical protein
VTLLVPEQHGRSMYRRCTSSAQELRMGVGVSLAISGT